MKFFLKVRILEERDLCQTAPFIPEDEDYEMYLDTLNEDLSRIDAISEVVQNGSAFTIKTNYSFEIEEVKSIIKPVFTETILKNLRIVSLLES
jgi:hypothetical protein